MDIVKGNNFIVASLILLTLNLVLLVHVVVHDYLKENLGVPLSLVFSKRRRSKAAVEQVNRILKVKEIDLAYSELSKDNLKLLSKLFVLTDCQKNNIIVYSLYSLRSKLAVKALQKGKIEKAVVLKPLVKTTSFDILANFTQLNETDAVYLNSQDLNFLKRLTSYDYSFIELVSTAGLLEEFVEWLKLNTEVELFRRIEQYQTIKQRNEHSKAKAFKHRLEFFPWAHAEVEEYYIYYYSPSMMNEEYYVIHMYLITGFFLYDRYLEAVGDSKFKELRKEFEECSEDLEFHQWVNYFESYDEYKDYPMAWWAELV